MVDTEFRNIYWYYSECQDAYAAIRIPVEFRQGLPDTKDFQPEDGPHLIVIDDHMRETNANIVDLFTNGSHHRILV